MECIVYEGSRKAGTLSFVSDGLYLHIHGTVSTEGELRRVYCISGRSSVYLGIPDERGVLSKRIPGKYIEKPEICILSPYGPGAWMPWQGELQGSPVEDCFVKEEGSATLFAVPQEQGKSLPHKSDKEQIAQIHGRSMILISADARHVPPHTETEHGGEKYETHEENSGAGIDPLLLADLPADYDYGGGEQ